MALAPALWFSRPGDGAPDQQIRPRLSSSLAFLQSLSRSHLVVATAGTAVRLLSWALPPFSTSEARGSTCRGFTCPATFRPQGLATLSTVFSPRARAGPVSCRQRSWDFALQSLPLSRGTLSVSAPGEPACRFPGRCSLGRILRPEPASRGFRALTLPRAPCPLDAVNAARAGCSPGLWAFPGYPAERLTRTPARVPPSRFRTCSSAHCKPRRPGVSINARLASS